MEVVASLSQGRTTAAQCGLFTYKSVPVIFEPPCIKLSILCLAEVEIFLMLCLFYLSKYILTYLSPKVTLQLVLIPTALN